MNFSDSFIAWIHVKVVYTHVLYINAASSSALLDNHYVHCTCSHLLLLLLEIFYIGYYCIFPGSSCICGVSSEVSAKGCEFACNYDEQQ